MHRVLLAFVLLVILAGCATRPQLTREEWLAMTNREYQGVSKEQAIAAAEKLLRLADGDDVQIAHHDDGFAAQRPWSAYMVIAGASGVDYWQVKAVEKGDAVRVSVQVSTQAEAVTPMATSGGDWTATTGPMAGNIVQGTALYDVFWARMDYLLGQRADWMDCKESNRRVREKLVWGTNEALCNGFNVADKSPVPKVEETTTATRLPTKGN